MPRKRSVSSSKKVEAEDGLDWSPKALCLRSLTDSASFFQQSQQSIFPVKIGPYSPALELHRRSKLHHEYSRVKDRPPPMRAEPRSASASSAPVSTTVSSLQTQSTAQSSLVTSSNDSSESMLASSQSRAIVLANLPRREVRPQWHAPWKLMRVISGHTGQVRCCSVDVSNEWFATGSADRTIIIWDLASGSRKVTLTGHISTVRDIVVSKRMPYLFSVGEDKMVKCWDLEQNKVVRHYDGHLSGVYCCALHPTLDLLFTGGRDACIRVWDIRTKAPVHTLIGHKNIVGSLATQPTDPQIISGSQDSTIRTWDLAAGTCTSVLTNHKKGVRSLVMHPDEYTFASASRDNIKKWLLPDGKFMHNFSGHHSIVNSIAVNSDNVMVSGGDNGSIYFWDWKTGHNYQQMQTTVQPGSLESEAGINRVMFDQTGCRLLTCEADKSIKIWKEDEDATPDTHPGLKWQPSLQSKRW